MDTILLFGILSVPVLFISRRNLFHVKSHGFYRFFSWECILWLFASNYRYWFVNPAGTKQLISWILLIVATYLVIAGVLKMKRTGKAQESREEKTLYKFERTTKLIDTGIFKHIRHPLYGSLIYLTWAIFFKNTTTALFIVSILSSVLLYFTAWFDEKECIAYFGDKYREYMTRSKMFVPFIF